MLFENINRLAGVTLTESFKPKDKPLSDISMEKGALSRRLGIPEEENIPMERIQKELSTLHQKKEKEGALSPEEQKFHKQLVLARTFKGLGETKAYTQEELLSVLAGMVEHLRAQQYEIPDDMTALELIQEMCINPDLQEEVEYLSEYGLTAIEFEEVLGSSEIEKQALKKLSQNEWFMKVSGGLYESDNSFVQAPEVITRLTSKFIPGPALIGGNSASASDASGAFRSHAVHQLLHKAGLGNYSEEEKLDFAKKELELAEKLLKETKQASDRAYTRHISEVSKGNLNARVFRQWKEAADNHSAASDLYLHARKQMHEVAEFGAAISELAIGLIENGYELPDNYTVQDLFHSIEQTPELASFIASDSYRHLTEYEKQVSATNHAALVQVPVIGIVSETIDSEWDLQNLYTILTAWNENRETLQITEEDQQFADDMDALSDLVLYLEDNGHDLGDYITLSGLFTFVEQKPELKGLREDPEYVQLREGFAKKASRFLKHAAIGAGAAGLALGSVPALAAGIGAHVVGKLIKKGAKAFKKHAKEQRGGLSSDEARQALHHAQLAKEIAAHEKALEHHYSEKSRKMHALGIHPQDPAHQYLIPSR